MATTAVSDWSVNWSIEKMAGAGVFGPNARFVSFTLDGRHTERNQFASTVLYGTVTVRDEEGARAHQLVIKMKHREPKLRLMFKSDLQFGNEILFYSRMVPFFTAIAPADGRPRFCRYFYGSNDCGDLSTRDMIVLENDTPRGYRSALTDHPQFLDLDHVVVALRTLAKFHAMSYEAKYTNRSKFMEIIDRIEDTQWNAEGEWLLPGDGVAKLLDVRLDGPVGRSRGDDEPSRRFRTELLADAKRSIRRALEPVEPLAVLCHVDFNRSNLMFRYGDDGKPADALPFDMATVRYGSPALDLSYFLYANTDRGLRDAHWDLMLDEYCAALAAAVSGPARESVPGRAQIDVEMREHAFFGLAQVSFFLRVNMNEQNAPDTLDYLTRMDDDDFAQDVVQVGGDEAADVIADAVQHFVNIKYADAPVRAPRE